MSNLIQALKETPRFNGMIYSALESKYDRNNKEFIMKRLIKKMILTALSATILFANVSPLSANVDDTQAAPLQIPVRSFFEALGAQVDWGEGRAVISMANGDRLVLTPGAVHAEWNAEEIRLTTPVMIVDKHAMMSFDDAALLFAGASALPQTLTTAVLTAVQLMEAMSIAGMTVAIVDTQNDYIWTRGFGYADAENQINVNEETLFHIGSTSKLFTAIAIMQLVEAGAIDLDEPIVTYLPELYIPTHPYYGGDYRNITTRMLLTHVSGLPGDVFAPYFVPVGHDTDWMNRLIPALANIPMQNRETERMAYCNNGFILMDIMVARAYGHENYFHGFGRVIDDHVFTPLGMDMSSFIITDHNKPYASMPHLDADTTHEFLYAQIAGVGGMVSNAKEMAMFVEAILNGGNGIISEETLRRMISVQDFDFSTSAPVEMGLGFMRITRPDGFDTIGHGGNTGHFNTELLLDFEAGLGVFVSNNTGTNGASSMLAEAILRSALREKTGVEFILPEIDHVAEGFVPVERSAEYLRQFT
ncbi:MAG: serine hydrolase, partial [Syntrophorhabdaceae bacterium]|nr:serine hydrolase [Syntrophorhabdaceae bacterium]